MAVLVSNGHIQNQLTRSLEKILDEANQSGELKLSNRKLKDFPKANDKYNLNDTVVADLSKNRFSELPEEVTTFHFLEKLHCYHNSIRYIPDTVVNLQCLIYLDLSRNQLTTLPRELCQLPIKILLISNNNLSYLPDELNRMLQLTELDASCNQLTHLPPRMGDLKSLQSLVLRNNLLLAVPIEVTFLKLVRLDLRANRIGTLPIEIRDMDSLIELLVDDNPLTSPPASLCKRGRVHIFKYLENEAIKLDRKTGNGSGTLGRRSRKITNTVATPPFLVDRLKHKRQNVDSGYSTSSDCFEKRWSQEMSGGDGDKTWNSTPILARSDINGTSVETITDDDFDKHDNSTKDHNNYRLSPILTNGNNENDEKSKPLHQIQTYREYKEALKQQRAQDVPSIYRTKDTEDQSYKTEPNTPTHQLSIQQHHHTSLATSKSDPTPLNSVLNTTKQVFDDTINTTSTTTSPLKRIERTSPFKNMSGYSPNHLMHTSNNSNSLETRNKYNQVQDYVKPNSPIKNMKTTNILSHDNIPTTNGLGKNLSTKINNSSGDIKNMNGMKSNRNISWNNDVPPEKMTFTMRREIDKAREESDLINQLRHIIETRLKMTLPEDLAPALTDGVVLCHLANHIKPRSVASIHVPSPAVPKLTMARCRRNVDNFIEACRKIGVDEGRLCSTLDVTEALTGRGLPRLLDTLMVLDEIDKADITRKSSTSSSSPPTTIKSRFHDAAVSLVLLAMFFGIIALLIAYPPPN